MASTRLGYLAIIKEAVAALGKKPTHFIRFKEGDMEFNQEIIENNPIQGQRWNAITPVKGKATTDGSYQIDFDYKEIGYWLYAALGAVNVTDLTGGAYRHDFSVANSLPTFSLEQLKGNPDGTDHQVDRSFGVMLDSLEMMGNDGILMLTANLKAHGIFQRGLVVAAESPEEASVDVSGVSWSAGIATISATSHGLLVGDIVTIASVGGATGVNGTWKVLTVPTTGTYTISVTTTPGSYTSGGTSVKQAMIYGSEVEGLAIGDTVTLFATGQSSEDITLTYVDIPGKVIACTAVTGSGFTKANKAKFELKRQTPSFSASQLVGEFAQCNFQFGDDLTIAVGNTEANIENWKLTYSNGLEERFGSMRRSPSVIAPKGAGANITYTIYFQDKNLRDTYLGMIKQSCVLNIDYGQVIASTVYNYKLAITMPDIRVTAGQMATGTDELYTIEVESSLFYDSGEGKAVLMQLFTSIADYTA